MLRQFTILKTGRLFLAAAAVSLVATTVSAQSAGTIVNVGPGFAGADASASGRWTHTDTESRVGAGGGSLGRGLAIGVGPNGLSLSHSIGVNQGGVGVGHNFNLSIGRNGTHVSHGGVNTMGGNSQVIVGGQTSQNFGQIQGGSHATGFGHRTHARTGASTHRFFRRW